MFKSQSTLSNIADKLYNALVNSGTGLQCNYRPGYVAYAQEVGDGFGTYMISYHKTDEDMPAFECETFDNANDCIKEMVKISAEWTEIEEEE